MVKIIPSLKQIDCKKCGAKVEYLKTGCKNRVLCDDCKEYDKKHIDAYVPHPRKKKREQLKAEYDMKVGHVKDVVFGDYEDCFV